MGRKTSGKMSVRIVHTVTKLELGGAQQNTLFTLRNLPDDYEAYLICGRGGFLDSEAETETRYRTEFCPYLIRPVHPIKDWLSYNWMVNRFRKIKPHIVHSHSSKAGIITRWAAKKAEVPVVIHTFHGFGFNPLQSSITRGFFIWLEKIAAKKTSKLLFVSNANMKQARSLGIGEEEQYGIVRSGINIGAFSQRKPLERSYLKDKMGWDEKDLIIGNISCFKPQKALHDFIEACRRLKQLDKHDRYKFVLVGDGILRNEIEQQIKNSNLQNSFELLGWKTDMARILQSFDIMLHTSRFEGLPRVFLEAMACAVPIVATAVDGAMDVIENDENGYLVPAGDIDSMVRCVQELLENNEKRYKYGSAGRKKLVPEFDIKTMSDMLNTLYNNEAEKLSDAAIRR